MYFSTPKVKGYGPVLITGKLTNCSDKTFGVSAQKI